MSITLTPAAPVALPRPQPVVAGGAGLLIAAGVGYLAEAIGWRDAALLVVAVAIGLSLYHAIFGFAGAYRRLLVERRGAGVRAQLLMLGLASLAFAPLLAGGEAFGLTLGAALAPLGVSVIVGAFLFGIGMQLGGACASGTLFTVGGGSTRMVVTLAGFVAGATLATAHLPWWLDQPRVAPVSLYGSLGWGGGMALQIAVIAALVWLTLWLEWRRHGGLEHGPRAAGWRDALVRLGRGGWPLAWGALALAALNVATLLLAGHPWSVTWGFTLWGGKVADGLGFAIRDWTFWQWPGPARALDATLAADTVSTMNIGIVLGALLAAGLAGRFAPRKRIPPGALAAAVIGGLLLGYGARLAFGCNIGAFFSGVASGSLHGWLWIIFALLGTALGIALRPYFGLPVARATSAPAPEARA